jgi:hypothetical protein
MRRYSGRRDWEGVGVADGPMDARRARGWRVRARHGAGTDELTFLGDKCEGNRSARASRRWGRVRTNVEAANTLRAAQGARQGAGVRVALWSAAG